MVQDSVEVAEHGCGVRVVDGGGTQRVAGEGGDGRGCGTFAAHVAQEQPPGAGGQREEIVEVAADLIGGSDVIVRGNVQTRHVRQGRRQQSLLQGGVQALEVFAFPLGFLAGAQQLGFVGAAVTGVEDGGADQQRLPVAARLHRRGDQDRKTGAVGGLELQGDAADLTLHAQQRRVMRLVIKPPADAQQVGEVLATHQGTALVAEPVQQCGVDLGDLAVQQGGQVTAWGMLVQILGTVLQQRGELRLPANRLPVPFQAPSFFLIAGLAHHLTVPTNAAIDAAVSSGAASWGQCPVAFNVTSRLPGICAWTNAPTSRGAIASLEH